jgi:hypothetical protein
MRTFRLLGGLGVWMLTSQAMAADLAELLPDEVAGYRAAGDDSQVDRDGLFSLIDGGAEVYRALNVRAAIERRYAKPGAADLLVDLFDMGSPADAYGAYRHDMREGPTAKIGNDSERQGGNLYFWKGRYYVSIIPLRAQAEAQAAGLALGRAIAARIPDAGRPPDLVGLLPPAGLVASQVHYFHDWLLFSRHTLLAGDNPLGLGSETEGLLARYRVSGSPDTSAEGPALMVIRFSDPAAAATAQDRLRQAIAAEDEPRSIHLRLQGRLLLGVLDAPDADFARRLLDAVPLDKGAAR